MFHAQLLLLIGSGSFVAFKLQMPGNNPEESIRHLEQGESLKSRIISPCHHSMARPQVADGEMASIMEG
jgi:hypothetical protein